MATIKVAGVVWEMNTKESLRALESLHARLCVLGEAQAKHLGLIYSNSNEALEEMLAIAQVPVSQTDGNLSVHRQNQIIEKNILSAKREYENN